MPKRHNALDMNQNQTLIASGLKAHTKLVRACVCACRYIWRVCPKKKLSVQTHLQADYVYMTICRKKDFDMVLASLYSLYLNSTEQPREIIIVSDGSWEVREGDAWFSRFHLPLRCLSWKECADAYATSCPALLRWAQKHIWGKKMAAITYCSENNAVLFCDPDVLWFHSPLVGINAEHCCLKVSIDNMHSYDQTALKHLKMERLNETENPINCGVVYMRGGLSLLGEDARRLVEYEAEHCGPFAEQTVFAAMDEQYDCRWSREEIRSDIEAALHPFRGMTERTPALVARHYLWVLKPLYWRDFFRMYFSLPRF